MKFSNQLRHVTMSAIVSGLVLAACAAPTPTAAPKPAEPAKPAAPAASPADAAMTALVEAAKKEGELNVIALAHDWANYGEIIESFKAKYGIKVNEINPDASSAEELEAIKANKDSKGPQAPDVVDVGFAFGPQGKEAKLYQPYKVSVWDSIPANLKDAEGFWYGDYYGAMAFEVNTAVVKNVPQDWADLLKPEYKGQVALAGDPRKSSQAISAVYAAAFASGGDANNATPGLEFYKKLNDSKNLVPVIAKPATIAKGETPIALRWDYNALANRDASKGNPEIAVIIPKSGVLAGTYVQAISAYAPHPNAAKLWMEYLYSDAGQNLLLKGYAHPVRYNDMVARKVIPDDLAKKLPSADLYAKAVYPTIEQLDKSKTVITEGWDKVVGADIK